MGVASGFWKGRRVLLTGHTGFKGGWLAMLLDRLGARVTGFALPAPTEPSLFQSARVSGHLRSFLGDLRDLPALSEVARQAEPEIIFHLAAQALVLPGYQQPLETFSTNVIGTAHVLEVARSLPALKGVVVVTSDKVYQNQEWSWGYRETDGLGGRDPYSASKACAELVTAAYRDSFLAGPKVGVATARAGNVIGGGDWSLNRIVPDFTRALQARQPLRVRNPAAVRPWQHVLEPLEGYLLLAEALTTAPEATSCPWNFGPSAESVQPVSQLADDLVAAWGEGASWHHEKVEQPHEAGLLTLDSTRARTRLHWRPRLGYAEGVRWTMAWYRAAAARRDLEAFTLDQVDAFLGVEP